MSRSEYEDAVSADLIVYLTFDGREWLAEVCPSAGDNSAAGLFCFGSTPEEARDSVIALAMHEIASRQAPENPVHILVFVRTDFLYDSSVGTATPIGRKAVRSRGTGGE